jgi:CMP-N-acetylneuraminic acid synthetase
MTVTAIVPARAGSKGIPGKNLVDVAGKPLIAWTLIAARKAPSVDRVIVSTDSGEIASVAKEHGAEVPFLRPPELARDETPGLLPVLHALDWMEEHEGRPPEWTLVLQATSPLRTAGDIEAAVSIAREKKARAVVSVTPAAHHPYLLKTVGPSGRLEDFLPGKRRVAGRQELPPVHSLNGAIYLARSDFLREKKTWYSEDTYAYVMPAERSLDVDTPWDLHLLRLIMKAGTIDESR